MRQFVSVHFVVDSAAPDSGGSCCRWPTSTFSRFPSRCWRIFYQQIHVLSLLLQDDLFNRAAFAGASVQAAADSPAPSRPVVPHRPVLPRRRLHPQVTVTSAASSTFRPPTILSAAAAICLPPSDGRLWSPARRLRHWSPPEGEGVAVSIDRRPCRFGPAVLGCWRLLPNFGCPESAPAAHSAR
jgi:hypothetical protein